jgi:hypothetical protein
LGSVRQQLGVRAAVDFRIGGHGLAPMTWGMLTPTILLPEAAAQWPSDRMHNVLAHELAHVRRRDGFVQSTAQLACAVYWFNPLAWYAAYRMRTERERACDDHVLRLGVNPEDYADTLVRVARDVTSRSRPIATMSTMAMTQASGFERRLRAILNRRKSRRTLSGKSVGVLTSVALLLTMLAANLHVVAMAVIPMPRTVPVAQASVQAAKWLGVWKLNRERSNIGLDPQARAMFDSIASATFTLAPIANGARAISDVTGLGHGQRQHMEVEIPFNVRLDFKDVSLFAAMLHDGTFMITPIRDDALDFEFRERDTGGLMQTYYVHLEVSNGGNRLTETMVPPDDLLIVFDRQ